MATDTDWNALAAEVAANFAATGKWFANAAVTASPSTPVDWNALAAQATANFAATGHWFVGDGAPTTPSPTVDWDAIAAEVTANFMATGQWFVSAAPATPSGPYLLFSQHATSPGTRDLWQPPGLVGSTYGTAPGLVGGNAVAIPLSAFDAFAGGAERIATDASLFALNGQVPSAGFAQQIGVTALPPNFTPTAHGAVLAGPTGTPTNPLVSFIDIGTSADHIGIYGLAAVDWGGIENLEMNYRPAILDNLRISNFVDVSLRFTDDRNQFVIVDIANAKRGEVDASALAGQLGLRLALASEGSAGDNTFVIKGSPAGNDDIVLLPGSWGPDAGAATRVGQLATLLQDGSASKVDVYFGTGHSIFDASQTRATTEVFGGPDPAGSAVMPAFGVVLAEPGAPGVAVFGGPVLRANIFYAGIALGEEVPVTLTTPAGPVAASGHGVLATRAGSTTPELALAIEAQVAFSAVAVGGVQPPPQIITGSGLVILNVNFDLPTLFGQSGDLVQQGGSGTLVRASQGADTIHYRPGVDGALEVQGFDPAMDRIVLEGGAEAELRIYGITDFSGTPQARAATLISFDDPFPGTALHSLIYLPGVSDLALGHGIVIG